MTSYLKLEPSPPAPGYRQIGWYCLEHNAECYTPLDTCAMIPTWALELHSAVSALAVQAEIERLSK